MCCSKAPVCSVVAPAERSHLSCFLCFDFFFLCISFTFLKVQLAYLACLLCN